MDSTTFTHDLVRGSTFDAMGIERGEVSLVGIIDLVQPEGPDFFRCEEVVAHFLRNCMTPENFEIQN